MVVVAVVATVAQKVVVINGVSGGANSSNDIDGDSVGGLGDNDR